MKLPSITESSEASEPTHCRENPDLNRILMLIKKITLFAKPSSPPHPKNSSYQRFNAITQRAALGDWTFFFSPVSTCNVTEASCRGTLGSSKSHSRWWHKTKHLLYQNTSKQPHPAPPSVCHSSAELHQAEHGGKKQKSVLLNKPGASRPCAEPRTCLCRVCTRHLTYTALHRSHSDKKLFSQSTSFIRGGRVCVCRGTRVAPSLL